MVAQQIVALLERIRFPSFALFERRNFMKDIDPEAMKEILENRDMEGIILELLRDFSLVRHGQILSSLLVSTVHKIKMPKHTFIKIISDLYDLYDQVKEEDEFYEC